MCFGSPCIYERGDGGCGAPRYAICPMDQEDITDDDQRDGDEDYDGDDLK